MKFNLSEYKALINDFYKMLQETQESLSSIRLSEDKWTLKEMIGHLIDSASNNHQRFVRLQLEEKLEFPRYEAESWKQVQKVNSLNWNVLIELWRCYNELLLHIIENVGEDCLNHYWVKDGENLSLEHLMKDYYNHIKWHLNLFEERLKEIKKK